MFFFDVSFWQGFVGNLFATIIGVALGIPVAFWINQRVETITQKEKKRKILHLLAIDLQENQSRLISWWEHRNDASFPKWLRRLYVSDETWDAFSESGELQWIKDIELINSLVRAYAIIKRIKYLSDNLLKYDSLPTDISSALSEELHIVVEDGQKIIEHARKTAEDQLFNRK